ncbi:unnamed protein product, partial [marine sediment metagenome]
LCLDTYGSFMEERGHWGEGKWDQNPYNRKNGGPCNSPEEFFTDPAAIKLYKNKLRYIISRWGYSPSLAVIELWNEYNAPDEWVKDIAGFIRSVNPHPQMVTTSMGQPQGRPFDTSGIWKLKNIALVTLHIYGGALSDSVVSRLMLESRNTAEKHKKPFIVSEFGIDAYKADNITDPRGTGVGLHNSIWSSALSKSFGTCMGWWWDSYIMPRNLYHHYKALSLFLSDVKWDSKEIEYVRTSPVMTERSKGDTNSLYKDVVIKTEDKWG